MVVWGKYCSLLLHYGMRGTYDDVSRAQLTMETTIDGE